MGETTTLPARPARHDEWLDRRWRLTGAGIALAALAVAVVVLLTGAQRTSFGSLLEGVADGDVTHVEVGGRADGGDWSGVQVVEVRWHHWWDRYAEVAMVRGSDSAGASDTSYVTTRDPREVLRAVDPTLDVVDASPSERSGWTVADWRVPNGTVALVCVAAMLAVLLLIVGGPEPRRATRWAWFWIWLLGTPIGALAFLLLGGPLARGQLSPGARRLTGGWAFLATWFLFAAWRERMSA
ncbi:hypothetical protein [Nocardioides zeicaulis]|uniref:DUF3592 domain-containing protein n=1 Tax=Nocardioides zeicaulis TaxID=1776857 RepID=A0ABV6E322_9ACTN